MKQRRWPGNPVCSFCKEIEISQHLFFTCPVARVVWRSIGVSLGTDACPNNLWQYYAWCFSFLPMGDKIFIVGLAVVT